MAVAVVERFKQELMYGLSARTKKCGCCREVAVSGGSTVFTNQGVHHRKHLHEPFQKLAQISVVL